MAGRRVARCAIAVAFGAWTALTGVAATPVASAQPCPDVGVIFARGTNEAPGVDGVGQAFVDAVRAQAAPRSVGVYAVNYPAGDNFSAREEFARTVIDGVRDGADRVQTMAANCPDTRLILGGYSQGAVVSGFVTSDVVPAGVPAAVARRISLWLCASGRTGRAGGAFGARMGAQPIGGRGGEGHRRHRVVGTPATESGYQRRPAPRHDRLQQADAEQYRDHGEPEPQIRRQQHAQRRPEHPGQLQDGLRPAERRCP